MTTQEAVRTLRIKCNLTQEQLGEQLKVGVRTISRYETDAPPQGKTLKPFLALARLNDLPELEAVFLKLIFEEIDETYGLASTAGISAYSSFDLHEADPLAKNLINTELYASFESLLNDWRHLYAKGSWQEYADKRLAQHHDQDMKKFADLFRTANKGKEE